MNNIFSVYTDGASRGNPGEASIGIVVKNAQGDAVNTISEYLGIATNNVAEYTALIRGLERVSELNPEQVNCYLDSQLVVRQMTGMYRIKHKEMILLAQKVKSICKRMSPCIVKFHHIPRDQNKEADALANRALDERLA